MARKQYVEDEVLRILSRKRDVKIDTQRKVVQVKRGSIEVGNGSWGKIDFLSNYCGYKSMIVEDFSR